MMETILCRSRFSSLFVGVLVAGWNNSPSSNYPISPVTAFCGSSSSGSTTSTSTSTTIGRRGSQRTQSLFAGRHRDSGRNNEWISKLEEEFNRSDNNNDDDDELDGAPRTFQTPVQTITGAIDLLDQIDTAPPNDLTIVLFFAHYCKTCQRAFVPYKQLANTAAVGTAATTSTSNNNSKINFIRFETSSLTPKQFKSLGIDRVPFLQIYRNGICVSSFSATQKINRTSSKIVLRQRLLEQIDACQTRSLTDWSLFRDQHDDEIEANKVARTRIREAIASPYQNTMMDLAADVKDDEEERLYRSVRTLTSESELLYLLKDSSTTTKEEDGSGMVAIMFHSHFDPSCVRAQHKFRKIAMERQQQEQQQNKRLPCTMARIEASILSDKTIESLGIQKYPHIQIYQQSDVQESTSHSPSSSTQTAKQCVASFSIPRSFLFAKLLHESLNAIDERTPEQWDAFYNQHKKDIESQQLALETILREKEQ